MRVFHVVYLSSSVLGVIQQMEYEYISALKLSISYQPIVVMPVSRQSSVVHKLTLYKTKFRFLNYIISKISFYFFLKKLMSDCDVLILRHNTCDIFELFFLFCYGYKTITMHHTFEIEELSVGHGFMGGEVRKFIEKVVGFFCLQKVAGIAGVTEEILEYERNRVPSLRNVPCFLYPNGIMINSDDLLDTRSADVPEFLFVASYFSVWHGLDLFLDELEKKLAVCVIHIVGDVPSGLKRRCDKDGRIRCYGLLSQEEISDIFPKIWCGLSSFALFRQNMKEACTLKVREYLNYGIPVYAGHRDAALPEEFPYYKNGDVNLSDMIHFAEKCRNFSKNEIARSAAKYISKDVLLNKFYNQLNSRFKCM